MSLFEVKVVRVGPVGKHENADTLGITKVYDYPVIVRLGEIVEGDLAAYVPVDAVTPKDDPRWAFLDGHNRIKARRLRGIFSMGLLVKAEPGWTEGQDVKDILRIAKYEPPEPLMTGGETERCPFDFPKITDIESLRRFPDVLKEGEEVWITEKVDGTSFRAVWHDGRLWVGSHREVKKDHPDSAYWKAARQCGLAEKLVHHPDIAIYGEVYGWVQSLRYGHSKGKVSLAMFDAMNLKTLKYLNAGEVHDLAVALGLPEVPLLHRGPWKKDLAELAEGETKIPGSGHVREGIVIRPMVERFDETVQRVVLKLHGKSYQLRKEA